MDLHKYAYVLHQIRTDKDLIEHTRINMHTKTSTDTLIIAQKRTKTCTNMQRHEVIICCAVVKSVWLVLLGPQKAKKEYLSIID